MREKRQHQRATFVATVRVLPEGGEPFTAESQDISVGGMFLLTETDVVIGTEVALEVSLPKLGEVTLPGFVRWTKDGGFGVQFGLLGVRETHAIGRMIRAAARSATVAT